MEYRYEKFCTFSTNHAYYADTASPDFVYTPNEATRILLANNGMHFRTTDSGFFLFFEAEDAARTPLREMDSSARMTFEGTLLNPHFTNIVNLGAINGLTWNGSRNVFPAAPGVIYGANTGADPFPLKFLGLKPNLFTYTVEHAGPELAMDLAVLNPNGTTVLQKKVTRAADTDPFQVQIDLRDHIAGVYTFQRDIIASDEELYVDDRALSRRPFIIIELFRNQIEYKGAINVNPQYTIQFDMKQTNWKYFLVLNKEFRFKDIGDPVFPQFAFEINDTETEATNGRYSVITFGSMQLNPGDSPVSAPPEGDVLSFESQAPVPCIEEGKVKLQLIKREFSNADTSIPKVVIPNLPNPSVADANSEVIIYV